MRNNEDGFCCLAQCKLTVQQSNLLDSMARINNSTRSYELRMILELFGRERIHIDADRKEQMEADRAGISLFEIFLECYPDKAVVPHMYSIPWSTGIHLIGLVYVSLIDLEMLNTVTKNLLFRYTNRFLPLIRKKYPEIAYVLDNILEKNKNKEDAETLSKEMNITTAHSQLCKGVKTVQLTPQIVQKYNMNLVENSVFEEND